MRIGAASVLCLVFVGVDRLTVYLEREDVVAELKAMAARSPEHRVRLGVLAHKLAQIVVASREEEIATLST